MAKSARGSVASGVSSDRVRSLCTPAERKLLDMSEGRSLSQAAPAEVQALLGRAREFRDKWRALAGKQSRAAKRAPRAVAEANARSHAKAELFDGAVKRFESQLKTLPAKTAASGAAKPTAVRAKPPKRSRVAGHRTARAGLRAELAAKVATFNPSPVAKPDAKPVAAAAKRAAVAAKPVVAAAAPAAAKPAPVSKAKQRKLPPAKAAAAAQAVRFDNAKQRSATALAKKSRLKVGGLATRRGSHVMAAGKRAQARRDKRR
jgi:hypothetical protein